MNRGVERLVVGLAALYVVILAWAMMNVSYDIWGAFVVLPVLVFASLVIIRRLFRDESPAIFRIAVVGLGAKFVGTVVRYWLTYDAYEGLSDSEVYHVGAKAIADGIHSGDLSARQIIPSGTNTAFIQQLTGSIYTLFGSSRLGAFFIFAWLAYCGTVLFVRAGMIAVPGIAKKRYAILVLLSPSLLYWPSSIGKEAWMLLTLGVATYGVARVLAGRWGLSSVVYIVVGLLGAGLVRPHFAAMWVGALVVALIVGLFSRARGGRSRGKFASVMLLGVAVVGLFFVGGATLRFLNQSNSGDSTVAVTEQVTGLFATTNFRTDGGGSKFESVVITGPRDWPYAIMRTMTRPLLNEARSFAELIPAIEMTALLLLAIVSWRRLFHVLHMLRRCPYVMFALVVLGVFGLAFSSFSNLAILTRQRSLVMPLFLLPFCLPPWMAKRIERPAADAGIAHYPNVRSHAALTSS